MNPPNSSLEHLDILEIEKLRSLAKARGIKKRDQENSSIPQIPRKGVLPLSYAQQSLWLAQLKDNTIYNIPHALRLTGKLDRAVLCHSFNALMARHEALRSVFVTVDGQPQVQLLPEDTALPLLEHDLRGVEHAQERLRELRVLETRDPFDLTKGPMIRARLIRLDDHEYVFLLTQHHIISDLWSMDVFAQELGALYRAFSRQQPNPLPPLAIQYPDYAAWQRQWLSGERLQKQTEFWRQNLADVPVLLELPTDRPRPEHQSFAGGYVPISIDSELTGRLRELSGRYGTTLFMTLLAAWAAVLSRISRQQDLVIGTPSANRGRREIQGLIGFFVNLLCLRVDLSGKPTVGELLGRVRGMTLAAQDHQDLPFEQVVEIAHAPRRLSHTPIFQVLFAWQEGGGLPDLPGVRAESLGTVNEVAKFDLDLDLHEQKTCIVGGLNYATALFDEATIQRQIGYLLAVLRAMVDNSNQIVTGIDLVSSEERALLQSWNATETQYPEHLCVHQLFEEQADTTPQAVAVICGDQRLTYAELNRQANRLAHYLISLGVKPDQPVAICVERGIGMIIGLLAILKAGGAYLPLDPTYPSHRLGQILSDARPVVLLSDAAGNAAIGWDLLTRMIVLDLDISGHSPSPPVWAEMPVVTPDAQALGLTSSHLAYIMYTSGSTGMPKGVMVPHCAIGRLVLGSRFARFASDEVFLQLAPVSFDASTFEIWGALLNGAKLALISGNKVSPEEISEAIRNHGVTTMWLTAALLHFMTAEYLTMLAPLRQLLAGGDVLSVRHIRKALEAMRNTRLVNGYGPTENTTFTCCHDITFKSLERGSVPIGRPITNTTVYILDHSGSAVPLGAVGELYTGGRGVARGYLTQPAMTAERFVPDPFSLIPGARMYRTGDLARYLPDGNIEFLGRNDHQVKIRGFRIELGEIEARLEEHELVQEAVVVMQEEVLSEKRLVAYVVPVERSNDQTRAATEMPGILRSYLAAFLPDYMVPAAFVLLEKLPLTANGKLDRKSLPSPDGVVYAHQSYEPPQGEMEQKLAELWQELLGVERVGRNDNFFDLGGHSLLAVRLLNRTQQVLGIELPMEQLFARPRLAELAETIQNAGVGKGLAALSPIAPIPREGPLPLSFAQQRLWFLAQLEDVSATYHIHFELKLHGVLDSIALRYSLNAIFARHEALRSVFITVNGQPQVKILPSENGFPLIEHDLRGIIRASEYLDQIKTEEAHTLFDLAKGPMIRARLIQLDTQEHFFLLTQHHIVSDLWSMEVFTQELGALYRAFRQQQSNPLPPLVIQYPDYAAWQRQWLNGERLQKQTEFWRQNLADAPVFLELPTDHPRPVQQSFAGGYVPICIDAELTRGLRDLSGRHGTTLFMTVVAAWAAVLSRLSGQQDLVIGTPSANRGRRETEGLIGFFVNTLALRIDLSEKPSIAELLRRVRDVTLAAQDHQDLPFEQVVEIVQPPRRLNHTPLFQVMLAWQNDDRKLPEFPDVIVELTGVDDEMVKYDLRLGLSEAGESIVGSMKYSTALFDEPTIVRQIGYLLTLLKSMAADPTQVVAGISLVAPEERALLVDSWNDTQTDYSGHLCAHQLFEEQARKTPEARAVACEDQFVSYEELNTEANRLAHYLIALGVKPDNRVAICVERSVSMVLGVLAIVKAGGAYVPVDPAYPSERLAQILADADPAILLSDAVGREVLGKEVLRDLIVLDLEAVRQPQASPPPWAEMPARNPDPKALGLTSDHLAYVIYTSGSTGKPKGVMGFHRPLINLIEWITKQFQVGPSDVVLLVSSLSFDLSVYDIFGLLAVGGCVRVASRKELADPRRLVQILLEGDVTFWDSAPAVFQQLFFYLDDSPRPEQMSPLRLAFFSGDWVPLESFNVIRRFFPICRMIALGGATEATVWSNFYPVQHLQPWWVSIPYGRPIQNARYYVLDEYLNVAPWGARGDLYIGGQCLTGGYLNRPELTAERFLQDPFNPAPGARMYKTGDLARHLPDGNLQFLGRNDHQVKIRGFRIELGEIESRLLEHPLVREAVVLVRENTQGEKSLVAYVLQAAAKNGEAGLARAPKMAAADLAAILRMHLTSKLPEYMVPAAFVRLDTLPLTPNGKLDRKALPVPERDAYVRRTYEAPQSEMEKVVANLWQEMLGIERVGRHDHFFELGGHSLMAVQLVDRLRRLNLQIEIRAMFATPILSEVALKLEEVEEIRL